MKKKTVREKFVGSGSPFGPMPVGPDGRDINGNLVAQAKKKKTVKKNK